MQWGDGGDGEIETRREHPPLSLACRRSRAYAVVVVVVVVVRREA